MSALQLMPVALSVGGSDSSAGAGIQADLKTFAALRVHGVCAVTAITAQNSARVVSVASLKPALVVAQIEALADDAKVFALKTGTLANARIVRAVANAIEKLRLPAPVVDPILRSTSGATLLARAGERATIDRLIPISIIVTPNVPEAEALSGVRIRDRETMRRAAEKIIERGARAVVIK